VRIVQTQLGKKIPAFAAPLPVLVAAAVLAQWLTRDAAVASGACAQGGHFHAHRPETLINRDSIFVMIRGFAQGLVGKSPGGFSSMIRDLCKSRNVGLWHGPDR